ncbi:MAG: hypothetical protein FWG36_00030 [Oscillospiraceae bacterium]|nr:hypothetical protein [Oscillospiraceae bacterium]
MGDYHSPITTTADERHAPPFTSNTARPPYFAQTALTDDSPTPSRGGVSPRPMSASS